VTVIFIFYPEHLDGVEIEEVDELSQQLYTHYWLESCVVRATFFHNHIFNFVITYNNQWKQQLINFVCKLFALKEGKKHFPENFYRDQAAFILNHFIKLLAEIIQDAVVQIVFVESLNHSDPFFTFQLLSPFVSRVPDSRLQHAFYVLIDDPCSHRVWSFVAHAVRKLRDFIV